MNFILKAGSVILILAGLSGILSGIFIPGLLALGLGGYGLIARAEQAALVQATELSPNVLNNWDSWVLLKNLIKRFARHETPIWIRVDEFRESSVISTSSSDQMRSVLVSQNIIQEYVLGVLSSNL